MRLRVIAALALAAAIGVCFLPPNPLPPSYHNFADQRPLLGIPNCLDVISNLPFLIVGLAGLLWHRHSCLCVVLFTGVLLIAPGSAYYHLAPDDARLVWDRLPMTIVFMAFFTLVLGERKLQLPLVGLGIASVVWWRMTGDLRPYVLVQYFPMLAIPVLLLFFRSMPQVWHVVAWYGVAKLCEVLDGPIFALGHIVSGHTLKHLAGAVATYWMLKLLRDTEWLTARHTHQVA